jgi:alkylation response protein AidB-like acyl-CoA dehydrogenase
MILPPGGAFRQALEDVNGARVHVAAMCCGMLDDALAEASAYGARRETFGKPLAAHQDWRRRLARAEADLVAARLTVREAARAIDAGEDAQLPAATAKLVSVETAARHLPAAAHAMGAAGLGEDSRMARHLLGVQGAALADGSTEMLLERVARLSRSV